MRFYLTSSWKDREHMKDVREKLREAGHEVVASWLDQEGGPADSMFSELPREAIEPYALKDMEDVQHCDALVLFTDVPSTTGASHTEFGFAWGLGKFLVVVGQGTNVFHFLPDIIHYPYEHDFIAAARIMKLGEWG